ncbi:MAG: phage tail protein [Bacteroidia bacterium]
MNTGFYFNLKLGNDSIQFQEVSGLSMEMGVEEVAEGGENRFKYRLPSAAKFSNLVLKRGLAEKDNILLGWVNKTLEENLTSMIEPKNIRVELLDANQNVLMAWEFYNAYPVKADFSSLNNNEGEVGIESLEFTYSYFEKQPISS